MITNLRQEIKARRYYRQIDGNKKRGRIGNATAFIINEPAKFVGKQYGAILIVYLWILHRLEILIWNLSGQHFKPVANRTIEQIAPTHSLRSICHSGQAASSIGRHFVAPESPHSRGWTLWLIRKGFNYYFGKKVLTCRQSRSEPAEAGIRGKLWINFIVNAYIMKKYPVKSGKKAKAGRAGIYTLSYWPTKSLLRYAHFTPHY